MDIIGKSAGSYIGSTIGSSLLNNHQNYDGSRKTTFDPV